jgi:hypothetical protein
MLDCRVGTVSCLHQVRSALVIAFLAYAGTNQRYRIHDLGQTVKSLRQLYSSGCRLDGSRATCTVRTRMRVKCLKLTGAAREPEQDNRLSGPAGTLGLVCQQLTYWRQPAQACQTCKFQEVASLSAIADEWRQWFHENSVELISVQ